MSLYSILLLGMKPTLLDFTICLRALGSDTHTRTHTKSNTHVCKWWQRLKKEKGPAAGALMYNSKKEQI